MFQGKLAAVYYVAAKNKYNQCDSELSNLKTTNLDSINDYKSSNRLITTISHYLPLDDDKTRKLLDLEHLIIYFNF